MHDSIRAVYAAADAKLLGSAISPLEGAFLTRLIRDNKAVNTLEIGCANGLSSMFICAAIAGRPGAHHIAIDPFQNAHWRGAGVRNVAAGGFDFFELIEAPSEFALPKLAEAGRRFDFALIDGAHTFDHVMVDFFYINRLLAPGGIVVFDDNDMAAINRVVRYVANYPCYEIVEGLANRGWRRRWLNGAKRALGTALTPLTKLAGEATATELLDHSLVAPSRISRLDGATMIAFRKIAEDARDVLWYRPF